MSRVVTAREFVPESERVGVLLMYHGTPSSLEELPAFYREVRRGRRPTAAQVEDLRRRYLAIGGTSPLKERTDAQVRGIADALDSRHAGRYVVVAGAKYSSPRIEDGVGDLVSAGVRRAVGVVLAPHYSTLSVGEYRRRASAAAEQARLGPGGCTLELDVVENWHLEPGLVALWADRVRQSISSLDSSSQRSTDRTVEVIFTAHSLPVAALEHDAGYAAQVQETAEAVAADAGLDRWRVAWQSAGREGGPWLGPDLLAVMTELAAGSATSAVVVCPVGFVSDHLEILYDLDLEAARRARDLGLGFARTESPNDDARFCDVVAQVVVSAEPAASHPGKRS
jgi:protoporphyrin/coproporphyrin ferrochelatase